MQHCWCNKKRRMQIEWPVIHTQMGGNMDSMNQRTNSSQQARRSLDVLWQQQSTFAGCCPSFVRSPTKETRSISCVSLCSASFTISRLPAKWWWFYNSFFAFFCGSLLRLHDVLPPWGVATLPQYDELSRLITRSRTEIQRKGRESPKSSRAPPQSSSDTTPWSTSAPPLILNPLILLLNLLFPNL